MPGIKLGKPTFRSQDALISEGIRNRDSQETLWAPSDRWLLHIPHAGSSVWKKDEYWRREGAKHCTVEFVTAGDLHLWQNGKEYVVRPGQAFILHKEANHTYTIGPSGFVHKRYVRLSGAALDTLLQMSGLRDIDVLTVDDAAAVSGIMHRAKKVLHEKPPRSEKLLSELAFRLINELVASSFARRSELVQQVIDLVQSNTARNLTNAALSSQTGMSSGYLIRQFRREMGRTPMDYHLGLRISIACRLLKTTHKRIKEISLETGFKDPLHFSRVFKTKTGFSPKAYRRRPE